MTKIILCTPKQLPPAKLLKAARNAAHHNPGNKPAFVGAPPTKMSIAVVTRKYWGSAGVQLTVSFMDAPPADLRKRILLHMNAWAKTANVKFTETAGTGRVRIARVAGGDEGGYWSYVGTDIEHIPHDAPTMNLEGFTMNTDDGEFYRVVRHETGHTLGCPHEHMRRELVELIDRDKAIKYFFDNDGWTPQMVVQQVLTPIEESSLMGTEHTDQTSIMCYQLPGSITKNGEPIIGGRDIDASDYAFMAKTYPPISTAVKPTPTKKKKPTPKKTMAFQEPAGPEEEQTPGGTWADDPGGKTLTITYSVPGPVSELWLERIGGDGKRGQLRVIDGTASPKVAAGTYSLLARGKTSAPDTPYSIEITTPASAAWKPNPARTSDADADILDYHDVVMS
ncbi:MAG: Molecular chaperone [Gemmatimonadetes bacterium]|nr:Molecular chaperone [Gemmatimonadota bacterium]